MGGLLPEANDVKSGLYPYGIFRHRQRFSDSNNNKYAYKLAKLDINDFYAGMLQTTGQNGALIHLYVCNHTSNSSAFAKLISASNTKLKIKIYYSGVLGKETITLYSKTTDGFNHQGHTPLFTRFNIPNYLEMEALEELDTSSMTEIPIIQ